MQVNSTASYSPSYTANFGAAEQAKSKAATKVAYQPSIDPLAKADSAEQASATERAQKVGQKLNAKA
ncbi:MAG: hypothetical protein QM715_18875 [Nibricoccus sp.]